MPGASAFSRISRPVAAALGLLVVVSIADVAWFVVSTALEIARKGPIGYLESLDPATFPWRLFLVHVAAVAATLVLTGLGAWHAARSPHLEESSRAFWLIALVVAAPLPLPLYWYLHVWRRPPGEGPSSG